MKIFNGTPHNINIIDQSSCTFNPSFRKWVSENPTITKSIPSNGMLNAKIESAITEVIEGITIYSKNIIDCDPLPKDYDIYIVSAIYAVAAQKSNITEDVYVISEPVFDITGMKVLGCLGISKAF
jgi:hypothetical protein